MKQIEFIPEGVCSKKITVNVANGILQELVFTGGCEGNLKAIASLSKGMPIAEIIKKLEGNTCGARETSCADQLTKALKSIQE